MADFEAGLEKLPPRERLRRVRELEEERRRELEEELARRRRELEQLAERGREELEDAEELEEEALDEVRRQEEEVRALEERVRAFRAGSEFVEESLEERAGEAQASERATRLYESSVREASTDIAYLMSGQASAERTTEAERRLYQNVRRIAELSGEERLSEAYHVRKLHDQVARLSRENPNDGYAARIKDFLNDIMDYRSE